MTRQEDEGNKNSLKAQAALLREALQDPSRQPRISRPTLAARASIIAVIAGTLILAAWLLLSRGAREELLRRLVKEDPAARAWTITVRNLPQPEPTVPSVVISGGQVRGAEPSGIKPATPVPRLDRSAVSDDRVPAGTGERSRRDVSTPDRKSNRQSGGAAGENAPQPEPAPTLPRPARASSASGGAAYDLILSSHAKMRELVSEGSSRWEVVKEDNDVIWIDIVIARETEEHYIWKVDLNKKTVQALSHAARILGV